MRNDAEKKSVAGQRSETGAFGPASRRGGPEFFRVLSRQRWPLAFVVLASGAIAALVLSLMPSSYRATALISLETPSTRSSIERSGSEATDSASVSPQLEAGRIRSDVLLAQVVQTLRLGEDQGFIDENAFLISLIGGWSTSLYALVSEDEPRVSSTPAEQDERALAALKRVLSVAEIDRPAGVRISLESNNAQTATKIVHAIVDAYLADRRAVRREANKRAMGASERRLESLRASLEAADRAVAAFREKSGLTLGKDANSASQRLAALNSLVAQARAARMERDARLTTLRNLPPNAAVLDGVPEVIGSPLIASLRTQEAEVGRRVAELHQRYGDDHPRLQQVRAEHAQLRSRITAEVAKVIVALQSEVDAARSKEAQLMEELKDLEGRAAQIDQSQGELQRLEKEAQLLRSLYDGEYRRFREADGDAIMLPEAAFAMTPGTRPYAAWLGAAVAAALLLGVGVVTFREQLYGGVRTTYQVEHLLGRPLLGMIPLVPATGKGSNPARHAIEHPASVYAEALRSAFASVSYDRGTLQPMILAVTSSVPGEGKTTFACSLAGLMALSNPDRRVLIVDCDLRRASVAESLGFAETEGSIDEYLSGKRTLDQVLKRDSSTGLYYVLARSGTSNAAEILGSASMSAFMTALGEQFDLVILDTPPLLAVADGRIAARLADKVLFVVRWERTPRELVVNAIRLLDEAHERTGVVLTQVDVGRHAMYGYRDTAYAYAKYPKYYGSSPTTKNAPKPALQAKA